MKIKSSLWSSIEQIEAAVGRSAFPDHLATTCQRRQSVAAGLEVFVRLGEDVDTEKLGETLTKRADKARKGIEVLAKKLANQGFLANAAPEMVEAEKAKQADLEQELALLERNLDGLG